MHKSLVLAIGSCYFGGHKCLSGNIMLRCAHHYPLIICTSVAGAFPMEHSLSSPLLPIQPSNRVPPAGSKAGMARDHRERLAYSSRQTASTRAAAGTFGLWPNRLNSWPLFCTLCSTPQRRYGTTQVRQMNGPSNAGTAQERCCFSSQHHGTLHPPSSCLGCQINHIPHHHL